MLENLMQLRLAQAIGCTVAEFRKSETERRAAWPDPPQAALYLPASLDLSPGSPGSQLLSEADALSLRLEHDSKDTLRAARRAA